MDNLYSDSAPFLRDSIYDVAVSKKSISSPLRPSYAQLRRHGHKNGDIITETTSDGATVIIRIDGQLDFSLHKEFRRAYRDTWRYGVRYVLDMRSTKRLDSSALGMMLLMREYVGESGASIRVLGCNEDIRQAFRRACFEQFFAFS